MFSLIAILAAAILVIVGFAPGFTVNPTFWNTVNVRTRATVDINPNKLSKAEKD